MIFLADAFSGKAKTIKHYSILQMCFLFLLITPLYFRVTAVIEIIIQGNRYIPQYNCRLANTTILQATGMTVFY